MKCVRNKLSKVSKKQVKIRKFCKMRGYGSEVRQVERGALAEYFIMFSEAYICNSHVKLPPATILVQPDLKSCYRL